MRNLFKANICRLKEAMLSDKLVVFVGAGVSLNSNVPTWGQLIESLKKELPENTVRNEKDFVKIAQLYRNYRKKKEYLQKIEQELKHGKAVFNPIHEIIFRLKPAHIVTTNYDNLLEQVISNQNHQYYKISKDKSIPYASYNKFLIKMHGDFDEGNIVLTEDDYLNYEQDFPLTETFVKSLFASKLVLFVGFSFEDYNLKIITNKVKNLLADDFQPMYLLNTSETDPLMIDYYNHRGLRIIDFDDSVSGELEFTKKELADIHKLTSEKGKNLYKLIHYIINYDPFKEEHKKETLVELLYNSIEYYFDELRIIGAENLLKFYPFNEEERAGYEQFTLITENNEVYDLWENLKLNFSNKRDFLKKYGIKYKKVVQFAIDNGIFWITKPAALGQNSPYLSLLKSKKRHTKAGLELFYELDFTSLNTYIETSKAKTNKETSIEDLELPFLLYKIGKYYEAYLRFKEVAQKCWQNEKYVLYFICQTNLKNLSGIVALNSSFLKEELIEDIRIEAAGIDLQDILQRIQVKNPNIHSLLVKINDFSAFFESIFEVSNINENIKDANEIVSNNGFSFNNHAPNLTGKTYWIWNIVNNNFITTEHFRQHKYVYKKAFEGFIISNSMVGKDSPRQSSKLEQLFPFHIMITYGLESKFVLDVLEKNHIKKLWLSEETIDFSIRAVKNAINSITKYDYHNPTQNIALNALRNLLLILSRVKLPDSITNDLIYDLIKNPHIEFGLIEEALSEYIASSENKVELEMIKSIIQQAILRSNSRSIPRELLDHCLGVIDKTTKDFSFLNDAILNKIISIEYLSDFHTRRIILSIYHVLPEKYKITLLQIVEKLLEQSFDSELCGTAYQFKIPIDNKFENEFVTFMEDYFRQGNKSSSEFYNTRVLYTIYTRQKSSSLTTRIQKLAIKSSYLNFLIDPTNFKDYSNFQIVWIRWLSSNQYKQAFSNVKIKEIVEEALKRPNRPSWLVNLYIDVINNNLNHL